MKYYKTIILSLVLLVLGFTLPAQSSSLTIHALDQELSEAVLTKAAGIIEDRLTQADLTPTAVEVHGAESQIQIQYEGDLLTQRGKYLLTSMGDLRFRETGDRDLFRNTVKSNDPIYELVESISEVSSPHAILGQCAKEGVQEVNEHLLRLRSEGLLDKFELAWNLVESPTEKRTLYILKRSSDSEQFLGRDQIKQVSTSSDKYGESLLLSFNDEGSDKWRDLTRKNINRMVATTIDGAVLFAPVIQTEISGGNTQITGNYPKAEMAFIMALFNMEELPAKFEVVNN